MVFRRVFRIRKGVGKIMADKKTVAEQFVDEFKAGAFSIKYDPKAEAQKAGSDSLIRGVHEDKVESIQEAISDIRDFMEKRELLHQELMANVEEMQTFINNNAMKINANRMLESELFKELTKKRIEIEEIRLAEKVNRWRDIAGLKREMREHMRELRDRQGKMSLIDRIMED